MTYSSPAAAPGAAYFFDFLDGCGAVHVTSYHDILPCIEAPPLPGWI